MKSLHPKLQRIFHTAGGAPVSPISADLEERVIREWRQHEPSPSKADLFHQVRLGLWSACAILIIVSAVAYPTLNRPADPSVFLANAAIQHGLNHE